MGFRFSTLFAAPLLLAAPALAQQESGQEPVFNLPRSGQPGQPQTPQPDRQGPELDVFRGAPVVAPPPVVTPTIEVPPPVTPAPQAVPRPSQPRPAAPSPQRTAPATPQPQGQTAPAPASEPAPAAPQAQPLPAPRQPAAAEPAPLTPAQAKPVWPWIAAAVAGLCALIAAALWRRRRKQAELEDLVAYEPAPEPLPEPAAPEPATPTAPKPIPAPPQPAPAATDRPWIDMEMDVLAARLTLMGATIGYALTLHNRGTRPAEDILIRSLIANADAQQQALFQQFFAGDTGMPVHSAPSLAPGETQRVTGELRLGSDQIAAVQMGQRALLIPLLAFDAQYRWTDEAGDTQGTGRTGRAFIVGQEQSPPVERLSPFRLDLGPRQYRTPGSRATALSLAS